MVPTYIPKLSCFYQEYFTSCFFPLCLTWNTRGVSADLCYIFLIYQRSWSLCSRPMLWSNKELITHFNLKTTKPNQTKWGQTKPSQAKPNQTKPIQELNLCYWISENVLKTRQPGSIYHRDSKHHRKLYKGKEHENIYIIQTRVIIKLFLIIISVLLFII